MSKKSFVFLILIGSIGESLGVQIDFLCKSETFKAHQIYACQSIGFSDFGIKKLDFANALHQEIGKTNSDVKLLLMIHGAENLTSIPANINLFFPNITMIYIGWTNIARVTSEDLRQFPNLELFSSNMNPITFLPGNLFEHNLKIHQIEFMGFVDRRKGATLDEIGPNLLGPLNNLKYAFFWNHFCISEIAMNRSQVIELNSRLHILCPIGGALTPAPYPSYPDYSSTTWGPHWNPTSNAPYTTQQPHKSSQSSIHIEHHTFVAIFVVFLVQKIIISVN